MANQPIVLKPEQIVSASPQLQEQFYPLGLTDTSGIAQVARDEGPRGLITIALDEQQRQDLTGYSQSLLAAPELAIQEGIKGYLSEKEPGLTADQIQQRVMKGTAARVNGFKIVTENGVQQIYCVQALYDISVKVQLEKNDDEPTQCYIPGALVARWRLNATTHLFEPVDVTLYGDDTRQLHALLTRENTQNLSLSTTPPRVRVLPPNPLIQEELLLLKNYLKTMKLSASNSEGCQKMEKILAKLTPQISDEAAMAMFSEIVDIAKKRKQMVTDFFAKSHIIGKGRSDQVDALYSALIKLPDGFGLSKMVEILKTTHQSQIHTEIIEGPESETILKNRR